MGDDGDPQSFHPRMQIGQAIPERARRARPVSGIVADDGTEQHGIVFGGAGGRRRAAVPPAWPDGCDPGQPSPGAAGSVAGHGRAIPIFKFFADFETAPPIF
jgi:hypothetical protein